MAKLSAVIIAKNEENRIQKCLDSLKGFVDEIVVVNNMSTDRTVEICQSYGAKVITHQEKEFFGRQRNIGIDNAAGEWILQMDADEIVPSEAAQAIKNAINNPGDFVAFQVLRRNFFLGHPLSYAGNYGYMTKVFKKGKARYQPNTLHEVLEINGPVGSINTQVWHYPFNSISAVMDKCNYYSQIEAEQFLRGLDSVSIKEIKYRLTWRSLKLFWKLYFKKQGYKDGMYGLAWCILNVIGPQVRWLKIWERALKDNKLK